MRLFRNKQFARWAAGEGIADADLCKAAKEAVDGDLGGYLFKKRVARAGGGKSGGYRTILGFRKEKLDRVIFLHGFPKSRKANVSGKEQAALSIVAKSFIEATDRQVDALKVNGQVLELECKE